MKKIITIIFICFSFCSCGQTLQKVFNNSITNGDYPTINAHGQHLFIDSLSDNGIVSEDADGFVSSFAQDPYAIAISAGALYGQATIWATDTTTNTGAIDFLGHGTSIRATPHEIKFQANGSDTQPITIIAHVPEILTITDIAVWDGDVLKKVHLTTPLTVEGFKTLITKK